jgi:two-component system, NtrC family, response regulator AtoC
MYESTARNVTPDDTASHGSETAGANACDVKTHDLKMTDVKATVPNVEWVAADLASLAVLELAAKLTEPSTTLLITGESGTGKDQLARWIHQNGPRRDAPFLKIDCASLPAELVESELFGHERGAFTGAVTRKLGRLEMAQGGTIVLDEIAALTSGMQAKLLRVIEERTFERLGGTDTLRMEARLMALTNTDLTKAVANGRFREDLFFRLNVLAVPVPPLRERRADIPALVAHFIARLGPVHGRADASLDPAASRIIEVYAWPGNVRELKNAIEHALIFGKAPLIETRDFPEIVNVAPGESGSSATLRSLNDMERDAIKATLEATRYKIGRAAEILGISRKTLLEKRKKYGLLE